MPNDIGVTALPPCLILQSQLSQPASLQLFELLPCQGWKLQAALAREADLRRQLAQLQAEQQPAEQHQAAAPSFGRLTPRQRQVLDMILAGNPNKVIASDLRISQRTVENHRAAIMRRTKSKSLSALVQSALASGWHTPSLQAAA